MKETATRLVKDMLDQLGELEGKGSPGFAAQVLEVFLQDTTVRLTQLREGLRLRDPRAAYEAAHSMQGSASMVGAASVAECCRKLAEASRAGSFDRCHPLAAELDAALQAIQRAALRH